MFFCINLYVRVLTSCFIQFCLSVLSVCPLCLSVCLSVCSVCSVCSVFKPSAEPGLKHLVWLIMYVCIKCYSLLSYRHLMFCFVILFNSSHCIQSNILLFVRRLYKKSSNYFVIDYIAVYLFFIYSRSHELQKNENSIHFTK